MDAAKLIHEVTEYGKDGAVLGGMGALHQVGIEIGDGINLKDTGVLLWVGVGYTIIRVVAIIRDEIRKGREDKRKEAEHLFKMQNFARDLNEISKLSEENDKLRKKLK